MLACSGTRTQTLSCEEAKKEGSEQKQLKYINVCENTKIPIRAESV
jgi:hypothetical protein